jgi:hypothetical protein
MPPGTGDVQLSLGQLVAVDGEFSKVMECLSTRFLSLSKPWYRRGHRVHTTGRRSDRRQEGCEHVQKGSHTGKHGPVARGDPCADHMSCRSSEASSINLTLPARAALHATRSLVHRKGSRRSLPISLWTCLARSRSFQRSAQEETREYLSWFRRVQRAMRRDKRCETSRALSGRV